jgi:hypothetical protein
MIIVGIAQHQAGALSQVRECTVLVVPIDNFEQLYGFQDSCESVTHPA